MTAFDQELQCRLEALWQQGLFRELSPLDSAQGPQIRVGGTQLLNFSSNDYLGFANAPALRRAACVAVERYGAGAGASRLICGSLPPHQDLDRTIAEFKGTEAALGFATGYAAALGAIGALLGRDDVIVLDRFVHASIVDAARLCGAKLRVFAHNDLQQLESTLKWADKRTSTNSGGRAAVLVVTESVFSMDGDGAPLRELVALKEKYGAWLMVDEAHATGLYGPGRRGRAEELGVADRIEVQMGTLGKAIGAAGGYICGSRRLIELLVNKARSFIFSTAPAPAAAAAATEGIRLVASNLGKERCAALWQRVTGLTTGISPNFRCWKSAIVPLIIGPESKALEVAAALRARGFFVPAIRYPTVHRGTARLRITLSAAHTAAHVAQLLAALKALQLNFILPPTHA